MNCAHFIKQPNLKLKTWPKQLLGFLLLAFELPALASESRTILVECGSFAQHIKIEQNSINLYEIEIKTLKVTHIEKKGAIIVKMLSQTLEPPTISPNSQPSHPEKRERERGEM